MSLNSGVASFETAEAPGSPRPQELRMESAMSMATVESFETAPEPQSGSSTPRHVVTDPISEPHLDLDQGSTQQHGLHPVQISLPMAGDAESIIGDTDNTKSAETEIAGTIDKLIDAIHNSPTQTHNSSAYSFTPLLSEEADDIPPVPKTHHSRHTSIHSLRSFRSKKLSPSNSKRSSALIDTASLNILSKQKSRSSTHHSHGSANGSGTSADHSKTTPHHSRNSTRNSTASARHSKNSTRNSTASAPHSVASAGKTHNQSEKPPSPTQVELQSERQSERQGEHQREPQSEPHNGPENERQNYPPPARVALILISLYIAIFLVALDRTIIGPAIPEITNKFHSIAHIGWYGSSYMLTSCGFILLYGRVYTFFSTKHVFLTSILLFEIGSAICGAANGSIVLIIGRAVAGLGSSGIFTGAILIILDIVPLHRRPLLQGLFGACFGVASVAGPLLGGAFTGSKATWRWCFYINLPLGGLTIAIVMLLLRQEKKAKNEMGWKETLRNLDPIGTLLFLPSITCLLLALEWGASDYSWNDPPIIALLTIFAILFLAFGTWQFHTRNTTATIPIRILCQRTVAFGGMSQFAVGATMLISTLYIPIWFQAIKGVSAIQSGIRTIPTVLSVVMSSIISGAAVQKLGYYKPFMILGGILMSIGAGLLTTLNVGSVTAQWIGFQVLVGLGVGFTMQHPNLAIQVVLPRPDIPTGTALLSLCQTLGGAVFVSVGQNTFLTKFVRGLRDIDGVDVERAVHSGATELKNVVPESLWGPVLEAYNYSLTKGPFLACVIIACFTFFAALGMEWRSVKEGMQLPNSPSQSSRDEETANEPLVTTASESEKPRTNDEAAIPQPPPRAQAWRNNCLIAKYSPCRFVKRLNPDLKQQLDSSDE